jgi:hypothetical protein
MHLQFLKESGDRFFQLLSTPESSREQIHFSEQQWTVDEPTGPTLVGTVQTNQGMKLGS